MYSSKIQIIAMPRISMSWQEFVDTTPSKSIALDGIVKGGPKFDPTTLHVNFDHHDGVVREATMSTAMQVLFAIKGGLMQSWMSMPGTVQIYINDTDQDTSLAVWLLLNYKQFEGVQGIPHINRLLAITDKLDITGGAYPMNLDDGLISQHSWVFQPYTDLRKSGMLSKSDSSALLSNLEATLSRINKYMMNQGGQVVLDTRHLILYECPDFKIVDEIGGNDARYFLFSKGMNAYISIVSKKENGNLVCTVGKRSQYIPFPVSQLFDDFNDSEGLTRSNGWDGSDIIGGSPRLNGTTLTWQNLRDITLKRLKLQS
jgi:hypothetical protein